MSLLTIFLVVIIVLLVIGLGWKEVTSGVFAGFNTVVNRVPELKNFTNEVKQQIGEVSKDVLSNFLVYAHSEGKGLKVYLTINTNLVSQDVEIITTQHDQVKDSGWNYMNNGLTELTLQYQKHQIENGEFKICVYAPNGDIEGCSYGYNTDAKEPVRVSVDLFGGSDMPQQQPQEQSQAQGQSSNNENNNNNALSQSQETTIYICKEGGCTKQ